MDEMLAPGVDVWTAQPQALPAAAVRRLDGLLDADERARAARLRQAPDRVAWRVAHGLLRLALADAMGVAPQTLRLAADPQGRPRVVDAAGAAADAPVFSLTHCRCLVACAVSSQGPVGIDAEPRQDGIADALLAPFLVPPPLGADTPDNLRRWTALEACRKAQGTGLADGLPRLALVPRPDGDFDLHDDEGTRPTGLVARHLPAPPGVVLTLACAADRVVRQRALA